MMGESWRELSTKCRVCVECSSLLPSAGWSWRLETRDIYLSHEERIAGSQTSGAAAGDKMIFGLGSGSSSIALVRVCSSLVSVCQGIFVQILSFICLDSRLLTLYCLFIRAFKQYLVRKELIWLVQRNLYFHIFNKIVYNYFFYF